MYVIFYPLSNLQRPQNDGITLPPCIPLITYLLHATLRCGHLFLVGCCVLVCQLTADLRNHVFYFHYVCIVPFDIPNNGTAFPHTLPPRAPPLQILFHC